MLLSLQFPADTLIPDGERITWDSTKGFIIANATYREIGLLNCEATVNGRLYQTNYLTHRQSKCHPQGCGHREQSFELHLASEILIFNYFFSSACSQYNPRCPHKPSKPGKTAPWPDSCPQLYHNHRPEHEGADELELPWQSEWPLFSSFLGALFESALSERNPTGFLKWEK